MKRKTLKESITFEGVGIHTGKKSRIVLNPSNGTGILFKREDTFIEVSPDNVVNTNFSTDLGKGDVKIRTVEHLLAVLHLLGITDLIVKVEGEEIPIMDGSGYSFYKEMKDKVVELDEEIEPLSIRGRLEVRKGDSYIVAEPYEGLEITYYGEFNGFIGKQSYTFKGNLKDVILARTFCFEEDIPLIKELGLGKGGDLSNTLVIGRDRILNYGGLRYQEEPVRHKIFDLIGDLYLLGVPVKGKFFSYKGGHTLNYLLVKEILRSSLETSSLKASPLSI